MTDDFILGDSALHQRLCAITELLGKFVGSAPRPLSVWQLVEGTGRNEREVVKLCAALARAGLLRGHPRLLDNWELACAPDQVTLEDGFRCVMAEQPVAVIAAPAPTDAPPRPARLQRDADLLVMQAAMAINQSVFQHLRQFSLDRLKFSNTAALSPQFSRAAALA